MKAAILLVMELPDSTDVSMGVDRAVVDVNDEQPDVQFLLAHCCSFASMALLGRSSFPSLETIVLRAARMLMVIMEQRIDDGCLS